MTQMQKATDNFVRDVTFFSLFSSSTSTRTNALPDTILYIITIMIHSKKLYYYYYFCLFCRLPLEGEEFCRNKGRKRINVITADEPF